MNLPVYVEGKAQFLEAGHEDNLQKDDNFISFTCASYLFGHGVLEALGHRSVPFCSSPTEVSDVNDHEDQLYINSHFYIETENRVAMNCHLLTIMEELLRSLCTSIVVALKPERERR